MNRKLSRTLFALVISCLLPLATLGLAGAAESLSKANIVQEHAAPIAAPFPQVIQVEELTFYAEPVSHVAAAKVPAAPWT